LKSGNLLVQKLFSTRVIFLHNSKTVFCPNSERNK
jgi:hypothetical protein